MKKAILYGAHELRLENIPLDSDVLEPDQLYVRTEVTALSTGTELGNYIGASTEVPGAPDYPRPIGYSNVGSVSRTGVAVDRFHIGQRVFSMKPHMSEYLARQDELLVPIPEGVRSDTATLSYLTQLGLAAMRQAKYEVGENITVVGLGVIGLCTVALAKCIGARVVGIANSGYRNETALRVGADAVFLSNEPSIEARVRDLFGSAGSDIVILTANTWQAYRLSMDILRPGGRASILGFPGRGQPPPDFNPLDPCWFYRKQLTLIGAGFSSRMECEPEDIRFNLRRNLEYILALIESGRLDLAPLISHRLPASRMREAYELADQHCKELIAAVFDWSEES